MVINYTHQLNLCRLIVHCLTEQFLGNINIQVPIN